MRNMIDIHTHIMIGIDDGAQSEKDALYLLQQAYEDGTTEIVLTPHVNVKRLYENLEPQKLYEKYIELKAIAQNNEIPINIHFGMEVMASLDIGKKIDSEKLLPMCNSKYMLVEYDFNEEPDFIFMTLHQIEKRNLIPIIAHPERYVITQKDPEIAYEWNKRGYVLQINRGSILGELGSKEERTANILLENNLAQIVASDCHSKYRKAELNKVYDIISKHYSKGYAELLLYVNPKRLLDQEEILIINPQRP